MIREIRVPADKYWGAQKSNWDRKEKFWRAGHSYIRFMGIKLAEDSLKDIKGKFRTFNLYL